MFRRAYLSLLSLILLSFCGLGCTTLNKGDNLQAVRVVSNPPGAKVTYQGRVLGLTPAFVSVPRKCHDQYLDVTLGNEKQSILLDSKYRWKDSFISNFVFLSLAYVGWALDIGNCSAYRYLAPTDVEFSNWKTWQNSDVVKVEKAVIVVAPPLGISSDSSLVIGDHLVQIVKQRYSDALVIDYETSLNQFISQGVDSFTGGKSESLNSVYQTFVANRSLDSVVQDQGEELLIQFQLKDVFTGRAIENWRASIDKSEIPGFEEKKVVNQLRRNFFWVPNTISVDFSGANVALTVDEESYKAVTVKEDGFWNDVVSLLGAVSLKYLEPPSMSKRWKWNFVWVPSVSANWGRVEFEEAPGIKGLPISTRGIVVGYGPEIQYRSFYGQLYFSIIPGVGYQHLSYPENNRKRNFEGGYFGWIIEAGYLYFFNRNWNARLFTRSTSAHEELWKEIYEFRSLNNKIEGATNVYGGISFGYSFSLSRLFSQK